MHLQWWHRLFMIVFFLGKVYGSSNVAVRSGTNESSLGEEYLEASDSEEEDTDDTSSNSSSWTDDYYDDPLFQIEAAQKGIQNIANAFILLLRYSKIPGFNEGKAELDSPIGVPNYKAALDILRYSLASSKVFSGISELELPSAIETLANCLTDSLIFTAAFPVCLVSLFFNTVHSNKLAWTLCYSQSHARLLGKSINRILEWCLRRMDEGDVLFFLRFLANNEQFETRAKKTHMAANFLYFIFKKCLEPIYLSDLPREQETIIKNYIRKEKFFLDQIFEMFERCLEVINKLGIYILPLQKPYAEEVYSMIKSLFVTLQSENFAAMFSKVLEEHPSVFDGVFQKRQVASVDMIYRLNCTERLFLNDAKVKCSLSQMCLHFLSEYEGPKQERGLITLLHSLKYAPLAYRKGEALGIPMPSTMPGRKFFALLEIALGHQAEPFTLQFVMEFTNDIIRTIRRYNIDDILYLGTFVQEVLCLLEQFSSTGNVVLDAERMQCAASDDKSKFGILEKFCQEFDFGLFAFLERHYTAWSAAMEDPVNAEHLQALISFFQITAGCNPNVLGKIVKEMANNEGFELEFLVALRLARYGLVLTDIPWRA